MEATQKGAEPHVVRRSRRGLGGSAAGDGRRCGADSEQQATDGGAGARAGRVERGGTAGDRDVSPGRIDVRKYCRSSEPAAEHSQDASAQRTEEAEGTASGRTDG